MMDASPGHLKNRARGVCYERIYIEAFEIRRDSRDSSRWRTGKERGKQGPRHCRARWAILLLSPRLEQNEVVRRSGWLLAVR
jgi:hypothetical protein